MASCGILCDMSDSSKRKTRKKISESDLARLRDLQAIAKMLKPLHEMGTKRDKAGNRDLHMDQYCLLVLMWLYNPIVDSLRGLQQTSEFEKCPEANRCGASFPGITVRIGRHF